MRLGHIPEDMSRVKGHYKNSSDGKWRDLRAIELGLQRFQAALKGKVVTVIADNMTALTYLKKKGGGTHSAVLNEEALLILRLEDSQLRSGRNSWQNT